MSLAPRQATITGPNKSVTDTGPLIDPQLAGLDNISSAIDGAVNIGKSLQNRSAHKVQQKQQAAKQQRADLLFQQGQQDRANKQDKDAFNDAFATQLININRSQNAVKQGRGNAGGTRLQTEKAVNSLLAQFPDRQHELVEAFRANNLSHLVVGNLEDEVSQSQAVRESQESGRNSLYQTAVSEGFVDQNTDFDTGVEIGRQLSQISAENARIKENASFREGNAKLRQEERDRLEEIDKRDSFKNALRSSQVVGGAVVSTVSNRVSNITTDAEFSEFQKTLPAEIAKLREGRERAYEVADYDPDALTRIDKQFDRYESELSEFVSGDLSHAKSLTRKYDAIQTNAKLSTHEVFPALTFLDNLPAELTKPWFAQKSVSLFANSTLEKSFQDQITGINDPDSPEAQSLQTYLGAVKDKTPITEVKDPVAATELLNTNKVVHGATTASLLSGNLAPDQFQTSASDFAESHIQLANVLQVGILENGDSLKEIKAASKVLFTPQSIQALTTVADNPATQIQGLAAVRKTRDLLHTTVTSLVKNSRTTRGGNPWTVEFDPITGQFRDSFSEDKFIAQHKRENGPGKILFRETPASGTVDFPSGEDSRNRRSVQETARVLNQALDGLVRTRKYSDAINSSASDFEYREAYATNDFSKLQVDNPEGLVPSDALVDLNNADLAKTVNKTPEAAAVLSSKFKTNDTETSGLIDASAANFGVPSSILHAIADQESGAWTGAERHNITGDKGKAKGIFQIHKAAATDAGFDWETLSDPVKNTQAGAVYFGQLLDDFKGDPTDALLAWNAGETKVRSWIRRGRPEGEAWQKNAFPYAQNVLARVEGSFETEETGDE